MRIIIDIETDNAAFHDFEGEPNEDSKMDEVARILNITAEKIAMGREHGACVDYNGNTVGGYKVTE